MEKYLAECLDSIVPQAFALQEETEILLIDDGSSDESGRICDFYQKKFPELIQVFHKKNEGLLITRKFGYERASGKYLINCDADDRLSNQMLSKIKEVVQSTDCDTVIYNLVRFDEKSENLFYTNVFTNEKCCQVSLDEVFREFFLSDFPSVTSMCGKAFKREKLIDAPGYDDCVQINQGEDTLLSGVLYGNVSRILYLNEPLYYYRGGSGMTAHFSDTYYKDWKKVFEIILRQKDTVPKDIFDRFFPVKYLNCVGRTLTVTCNEIGLSFSNRKRYIKQIREDDLYLQYYQERKRTGTNIKKRYRFLLYLLERKRYFCLHVVLSIQGYWKRLAE